MARKPLEGVRVLAQAIVWAGPWASMILADLGAEVIEVETIEHLNPTRTMVRFPTAAMFAGSLGASYVNRDPNGRFWDRSATWNYSKRGHLGITMDLTRPRGKELFLRLVQISDVFLENNAGGVIEKLGITYDALQQANPQIIMISFPGYGITGPYRYYKGYGANVEAVGGHTLLRGYTDSDPTSTFPVYHADPTAGAHAAFAVLAALNHRRRTEEGQYIDMSQLEALIQHLGQAVMDYSMNRRSQGTLGNRDPSMAPHGVYRCRGEDSWVAIAVADDEEFGALCRVMDQPELAQDPRFAEAPQRYQNQDDLGAIISAWTAERNNYQVFHALQKAGVAAGPVIRQEEMREEPHLQARQFFQVVTHPEAGTHSYPGPFYKASRTPPLPVRPAPMLGQHNEYVYKQLLGLSDAEYQQLWDEHIIGDTYLDSAT